MFIHLFDFKKIVTSAPTKTMTSEEKDTVWKFRFYLSAYKNVNICDVCRVLKNALTVFNFVAFVM